MSHDCNLCEYQPECFWLLRILNRLFGICKQGRLRRGMRQTARDQARLPVDADPGAEKVD